MWFYGSLEITREDHALSAMSWRREVSPQHINQSQVEDDASAIEQN
jgi:hypothetical protein